jgi:hypothetical protein
MKVVARGVRRFCNVNIEAIMIEHVREHYGHSASPSSIPIATTRLDPRTFYW